MISVTCFYLVVSGHFPQTSEPLSVTSCFLREIFSCSTSSAPASQGISRRISPGTQGTLSAAPQPPAQGSPTNSSSDPAALPLSFYGGQKASFTVSVFPKLENQSTI